MTYLVHYGRLLTGQLVGTLPWTSCRIGDSLRGNSSFDTTLSVGSKLWRDVQGPRDLWAVEWAGNGGRQIVAAGVVWPTEADTAHRIAGAGIMSILDRRLLVNPAWAANTVAASVLTWTSLDLGSIARQIVATVAPDLPITLEAARAGTHERTYPGHEMAMAGQRIRELTQVVDGPDVVFQPGFITPVTVGWAMRTGTQTVPDLWSTLAPLVLDGTAPAQEQVGKVRLSRATTQMATNTWGVGAGIESGRIITTATGTLGPQWPRLDAVVTSNDTDTADVQRLADGWQARATVVPASVTVQVDAAWWWSQQGRCGLPVRLIADHPVAGRVDITSRVIEWSADLASRWVELTLADTTTEI